MVDACLHLFPHVVAATRRPAVAAAANQFALEFSVANTLFGATGLHTRWQSDALGFGSLAHEDVAASLRPTVAAKARRCGRPRIRLLRQGE